MVATITEGFAKTANSWLQPSHDGYDNYWSTRGYAEILAARRELLIGRTLARLNGMEKGQ
jgi:hypothetical protein